jgi:hypothetical protein
MQESRPCEDGSVKQTVESSRKWQAIGVGTLVLALTMWFGFLSARTSPIVATSLIAVGLVLAMYAVAGFSRVEDPFTTGFKAALFALITGVGLLIAYMVSGNASFVIAAPVTSAGVGGSFALVPVGERGRGTVRQAAAILVALAMTYLFRVDDVIYALVSPLVALPAIGIADRFYDRGKDVVAEDSTGDQSS